MAFGITEKNGQQSNRIDILCPHHGGIVYVVPSEASWVCSEKSINAHAISGFFTDVSKLDDPKIREIMQKWGLYFRERPLPNEDSGQSSKSSGSRQES